MIVECKATGPTSLVLSWKHPNAAAKEQALCIQEYAVELAARGDGGAGKSGGDQKSALVFVKAYHGSALSCELKAEPLRWYVLRVRACDARGFWSAFSSLVECATPPQQPLIRFETAAAKIQLTNSGRTATEPGGSSNWLVAVTNQVDTTQQKVLLLFSSFCGVINAAHFRRRLNSV